MVNHKCADNRLKFCFVCTEYVKVSIRPKAKFGNALKEHYKKVFALDTIPSLDEEYAGGIICNSCSEGLRAAGNRNKTFRFKSPAVWNPPTKHNTDCFVCTTSYDDGRRKFNGLPYKNVIMPVMSHAHPKARKPALRKSDTVVSSAKKAISVKSTGNRGRPPKNQY